MQPVRCALVLALVVAALLAGCRFIVPADSSPQLPEPGLSGAPFPSPSLEVPPPID